MAAQKRVAKKTTKKNYIICANKNCIRGGEPQVPSNYYKSRSSIIDFYPICKKCIENNLDVSSIESICDILKDMNTPFIYDAWNISLIKNPKKPLDEYIKLLDTYSNGKYKKSGYEDSIFEPGSIVSMIDDEGKIISEEVDPNLIYQWGEGFTKSEYEYLERRLEDYKKTHKCDNSVESMLLKEICQTELSLREARKNKDYDLINKINKTLQDYLKTAAIDPAKANALENGRNKDSFSVWIKNIEEVRPCEWYEDKEKYKDIDGIEQYISDYIVRPMKNFITGSRDFNVSEDLGYDEGLRDE